MNYEERREEQIKIEKEKYMKELKVKIKLIPLNTVVNKEMLDCLTIKQILEWRKIQGYPEVDKKWLWN